MSNTARAGAGRNAPLFAWLGPLAGIAELGTSGYPRPARRQMAIVNLMAALIAIFSAVYAVVFALYGADTYLQLIVANLLLVAVALLVPLAHRVNDIAGALLIAIAEFAALFYFVRALGHDSGIQINYIVAAAVAFAICGMTRFRLTVGVIVAGLGLHLAAWFLYPPERAMIAAPPTLLANLYVSSAVTTFGMIALIVGYAFTLADRARAEADTLLANILPDAVAERLKERPGERVADSVAEASVLFSDLVGFTELAKDLGAARTVALLDQVRAASRCGAVPDEVRLILEDVRLVDAQDVPEVLVGGSHLEHLERRLVVPGRQELAEEPGVDGGQRYVHRHHRPDLE